MIKAENPKSRVMPRSLDYGFLSKPAVDAMVLRALHREVLPESIWPSTPRFTFKIRDGFDNSAEVLSIRSILNFDYVLSTIF
jgi:hypothetical protein